MKKFLAILLCFCLGINLIACNNTSSAKDTVTKFCESLKKLDEQEMNKCLSSSNKNVSIDLDDIENDSVKKSINNIIKNNTSKIKYNILEEKNVDGKTEVKVEFEYTDLSLAFTEAISSMFSQALMLAFSGDTSEEALEKIFTKEFNNYVGKNNEIIHKKTITFTCENIVSKWLISDVDIDELTDVVSGGIISALSKLADTLS